MSSTTNISKEKSPDLFERPWLNKLTRTHVAFPVGIFLVSAVGLLYFASINTQLSVLALVTLFFGGLLFFTFTEYSIHRWVYHPPENASEGFVNFTYKIHGIHHDYPKDKQRLAMPPWLTVLISVVLLLLFKLIMGQYSFAFLAGFFAGYAFYLMIHYTVHIFPMPKNRLRVFWVNHAIHHYSEDDIMFGVSNPLWDYIFGTYPSKEVKKKILVKK